jgi:hypothetical protein
LLWKGTASQKGSERPQSGIEARKAAGQKGDRRRRYRAPFFKEREAPVLQAPSPSGLEVADKKNGLPVAKFHKLPWR